MSGDAICVIAFFVGFPISAGTALYLVGRAMAANVNAQARLLEAQTASHPRTVTRQGEKP